MFPQFMFFASVLRRVALVVVVCGIPEVLPWEGCDTSELASVLRRVALVVGGIPRFFRRRAATHLSPELSIHVNRLFLKSQPTFTLYNP